MVFEHDISPILFEAGPLEVRWYGLFFAVGLVLAYLLTRWIFKREKYSATHLDSLAVYLIIGLIVGARLGHIIFYNLEYFLAHPLEIFQIWNGGLASHGAAIGVFIAYLIWIKVHKVKFTKYPDALVICFPIVAMFVRIGNFFNSEIVGVKSGCSECGVIFRRLGEDFPRHPAQLYEAVLSLVIFVVLFLLYDKYYKKTPALFFMFLYMFMYFMGRFFIEFYKDLQGPIESMPITMGQLLSILPVLLALGYFIFVYRKQKVRGK